MKVLKIVEELWVHNPIYITRVKKTLFGNKVYSEIDWDATIDYIQENYCSEGQEVRGGYGGTLRVVEVVDI